MNHVTFPFLLFEICGVYSMYGTNVATITLRTEFGPVGEENEQLALHDKLCRLISYLYPIDD